MTPDSWLALFLVGALFVLLSLSLLWLWLDYQEKKRANWTHMRSSHLHHIILCCWPFVLGCLIVILDGQGSDLLIWGITLLTGIFLYSAGLWDLRFERIGIEPTKVEVASPLLIRLSSRYPFAEAICGTFGIALGLPMLFLSSFPSLSFLRVLLFCGIIVGLVYLMRHLINKWKQLR